MCMKGNDLIMNKIEILQFASLDLGGITSLLMNVAEKMDRNRFVFNYLVYRNQIEPSEYRMQTLGGRKIVADISHVKNNFARGFYKMYITWKVLREEKVKIIQINASTPYDIVIGISARLAGVKKIILHAHNEAAPYRKVRNRLFPLCRCLMPYIVDTWLACSEASAVFMFPNKIVAQENYKIVKNGIDLHKFRFCPEIRKAYRKKHRCEETLVLGNIGRFSVQKNHIFLLQVFAELKKKKRDVALYLYGIGELEEQMKQQAVQMGIDNAVFFEGGTDRPWEVLQMMDVFIMTSLFEGLPLVAIEAQAVGLPLLLADSITKEVVVTDDVNFCSLQDPPEIWADVILQIYDKRKEQQRSDTTERVRTAGFDIIDTTKQLCRIYEELEG